MREWLRAGLAEIDPFERMQYVWGLALGVGMYVGLWWGIQQYAALDTVGDWNIMPAMWLIAGIAAGGYLFLFALGFETPVAVLVRLRYGRRMAWRSYLLADARHVVRFVAERWPVAIALTAFVAMMGVVNLSLYVFETEAVWTNERLTLMLAATAALTVVNSLALIAVTFHVLNPVPWLMERVAESMKPAVERVMER